MTLHRLQGELLLRLPRPAIPQATACFHQALAVARHQQAKALELRAALSLSRLWQQQGKRAEAHELLASVYSWFTEGFDTADLQEAKTLLEDLSAGGAGHGEPRGVAHMAELLPASVQHQPQDLYRRRLVQTSGGYNPSGSGTMALEETSPGGTTAGVLAEATPFELLTNREIEVLRMLQERLSNKEIAARLFVSAETVKKHTRNLYRKLYVHGRRQAVATARQRHLLSSD
jgi:ATP/maltotriose-dependent transcriptional regulator MalT